MQDRVDTLASARSGEKETGEIGRIVEQLSHVHDGGAWHGPSMAEALEGLSGADAARHPIGAAHCIAEIVHHARVIDDQVCRHLTGETEVDEADWSSAPSAASESAWRDAVERLQASQRALREAASRLSTSGLHETISGKTHSYWYELLGALQHEAYHAGQISLLRKGRAAHAVLAEGRSPEIPESADAYGWLIGSWELDVIRYWTDVADQGLKAEAHFAWVLEGRAVQDVWIMPRRAERTAALEKTRNMFGTTLRVWDPSIEAWRVTWINPVTGSRDELIGRRVGNDIVQVGAHAGLTPIRWTFTDIEPESFRWVGESLNPDGRSWALQGEFRARRTG